ncbi:MAG: hypothetical protein PSX37_09500, partial [bacterium]|nr:hypothetical protein [bacterium]
SSPSILAGVVCIAGGQLPRDVETIPPMFFIAGGLDRVTGSTSFEQTTARARAAGLPVEFTLAPDHGHTLLVGDVLTESVEWCLSRQLPQGEPKQPIPSP